MHGQANGPGSVIAFFACMAAALFAECIPVLFIATLVAVCGVARDFARGNTTAKKAQKKRPARVGARCKALEKDYSPLVYGEGKGLSR